MSKIKFCHFNHIYISQFDKLYTSSKFLIGCNMPYFLSLYSSSWKKRQGNLLTCLPSFGSPISLSSNFRRQVSIVVQIHNSLFWLQTNDPKSLYFLFITISWCYIFLPPIPFPFFVKLIFQYFSTTFPCQSSLIKTQFTHLHVINTSYKKDGRFFRV